MTALDASIIILTLNGGSNFSSLLERICSQRYGPFEVIVIDSGSTDGTPEVARNHPARVVQIKPEEFHHSRTRNFGVETAQGKYVVFVTQDAEPVSDDWLHELTDGLADPQVGMVVGRQVPREQARLPEKFFCHYNFPDFRIVVKSGASDYYHDNVFISNVNSAYRRDTLLQYRFDERLVMAEDKEIAARMLAGGLTVVYDPDAAVYHSHDFDIGQMFGRALDYGLALRQGAAALPTSKRPLWQRALEMTSAESEFLKRHGGMRWLPYILVYNVSYYAGLALGRAGIMRGPMARRLRDNSG